ncbi:MAG TPA: DUF5985 family protein [Solirubrobacteraceae bacterium]|nr:DUF5985 family protein [Solirubrobacteraceae bacterium]
MATAVYALCALLSLACALLLLRAWRSTRARLLLWSALCFAWLALSNVLLFVDLAILGDDADLRWARSLTFLAGTASLLVGLVWDAIEGSAR